MSGVTTLEYRQDLLKAVWHRDLPAWTSVLVCLTRKVPTSNASPDQLDEPTGGAYARQSYTVESTHWALQNTTEMANSQTITFPIASLAWGTINGWAILSNEATPRTLAVGTLNEPIRVLAGVQPQLGAGAIVFGEFD